MTVNSNVRAINLDGKTLFESIKKSGWDIIENIPKLTDWKVMEDHFDFHTVPGSAIKNIILKKGGDPLILSLDPNEWFGDWKIAIFSVTADYGIVLINEDAPKVYYGENGIVLSSLKDDLQKIIDKMIESEPVFSDPEESSEDFQEIISDMVSKLNS